MKPSDSKQDRDSMSDLLHQWKVNPELPPRFQENVWRGIERAEALRKSPLSLITLLKPWLEHLFPRPAVAFAYVSVMLLTGGIVGMAHGQHETRQMNTQLSLRYVQSVDPYQALPNL